MTIPNFMSLEKRRTLLSALHNIQQLHGVVGQDIAPDVLAVMPATDQDTRRWCS